MVYGSREKMEQDAFLKVTTAEQRDAVTKLSAEFEEWLYEGSTQKSEYEARVQQLKGLMDPMQERVTELEEREDVVEVIQADVDTMKQLARHISKNMTWVSENKTTLLT